MSNVPQSYWEDVEVYSLTGLTTEDPANPGQRRLFGSQQIGDTLRGIALHWLSPGASPVASSLTQLDSNVSRMLEWLPESYVATLWRRGCARAGVGFPYFATWRASIVAYLVPTEWPVWAGDGPESAPDPGLVPTNLFPPYTVPLDDTTVAPAPIVLGGNGTGTLPVALPGVIVTPTSEVGRVTVLEEEVRALREQVADAIASQRLGWSRLRDAISEILHDR